MRCLIIRPDSHVPEARELVLAALRDVITDWIEIPPELGTVEKYLRQSDFIVVTGTAGVSKEFISHLAQSAHLPIIIVTSAEEDIREISVRYRNVRIVPTLVIVNTGTNRLSERIRAAYFSMIREELPHLLVAEVEYSPFLIMPHTHLSAPIREWFGMGWRVGRLIVWEGTVWEILQDVLVPCGDYGSTNHRVVFCREREDLHQAVEDQNQIEVYAEKWQL